MRVRMEAGRHRQSQAGRRTENFSAGGSGRSQSQGQIYGPLAIDRRRRRSAPRENRFVIQGGSVQRRASCFLMPRANDARGKVLGALPRTPARGTPPETPGPLSLSPHLPERSSLSRVRFAAQTARALDRLRAVPKKPLLLTRGKAGKCKDKTKFLGPAPLTQPAFSWKPRP